MCGLIGFATTEKSNPDTRRWFMQNGIRVSMDRGEDATGWAEIRRGTEKSAPEIYKDTICGYDFVRRDYVENRLNNINDFSMLIAHTRSATKGSNIRKNAHPFQHKHITLTHNGTVDNPYTWLPLPANSLPQEITVDSHKLCYALGELSEKESEQEILEKLTGAYALVWHNARDGSLNIARNDRKPLYFAYVQKENTMMWASEYNALVYLMERNNLEIDDMPVYPGIHKWYKFFIEDLRRTRKDKDLVRPFVQQSKARGSPTGTAVSGIPKRNTNQTTTTETEFREPTAEELAALSAELAKNSQSWTEIPQHIEGVKEWLRSNPRHPLIQQRGVPTTVKKISQAIRDLALLRYTFAQPTIMYPNEWRPYKAKRAKVTLGDLIGSTPNGTPVVMTSVTPKQFEEYIRFQKVYIRTVNVKQISKNEKALVAIEHETHKTKVAFFEKERAVRAEIDRGLSKSPNNESETRDELVCGPHNTSITRDRFNDLVANGCGNCSCDLPVDDHELVTWIHDSPICFDCANDADIAPKLGIMFPDPEYRKGIH